MGALDGRVAIITGAGRGLGRAHALLFAAEGAKVVVNDLGDEAEAVAAEIRSAGGEAVAFASDVTDWDAGEAMVATAVREFGDLHVLVNNAGFLRDRMVVSMSEAEWDDIVAVHLKGHFVPTRFAAAHWREQAKAGVSVQASIVHTSSTSGLLGNPGQTNYGAAKAGIGAFSIICAQELGRYGVRSNCLAPAARTRLTEATPGLGDVVAAPAEGFDLWDPANVSPLVAYLATAGCELTGRTFFVQGGTVRVMEPWSFGERLERDGRWTIEELAEQVPGLFPSGS
ncbi:MAG TPA: SDR family oxidoreductase [Acidimicrobiales bacterium]|nr:SDR family oxidoreductase [Acidimicrobiales bacterium]